MKKTLLIAALASAALVSCSKVQVVEQQQDEIKFSVVADNATKAAHVYGTNDLMSSFTVYADYDTDSAQPIEYISGDEMTVISASEINYAANVTRYWPATVNATNTMTFYAIADGEIAGGRTAGNAPTVNYTVLQDVSQQLDLLYAVQPVTSRGDDVALNFAHALSLIEFRAKCTNSTLKVTVSGVKVGKVNKTGVFTFPTGTTDSNIADPDNDTNDDLNREDHTNTGSWSGHSELDTYSVTLSPVVELTNDVKALTYKNYSGGTSSNSMILLPQTLNTPWSTGLSSPDDNFSTTTRSYLAVNCIIRNDDSGDSGNGTILHNGWAYMPLGAADPSPTWEPGKKYVYTFVFGTGNAGYDENGESVLAPIDYTVTVDDFDAFTGGNTDVEME